MKKSGVSLGFILFSKLGIAFDGQPQAGFERYERDVIEFFLCLGDAGAHPAGAAVFKGVIDLFGFFPVTCLTSRTNSNTLVSTPLPMLITC